MKTFKNFYALILVLLAFIVSSCSVVEGIFKAGMGVGIFIVIAVALLIIVLVIRLSKK